jgi:uncharacterized membrane protein
MASLCEEELTPMRFALPQYVLLLIPSYAVLFALARQLHGMPKARRRFVIAVRFVLLTLLVFALAGLQTLRPNRGVTTIFLLDRSASMSAQAQERAMEFMRKALPLMAPQDRAGLIVFGKEPVLDVNIGSLRTLGKIYASPDASESDLAAAIRLASASFGEGTARRIVLLTDGNETVGDAVQSAEAAAADSIQIDVVRLSQEERERHEVILRDVNLPSEVGRSEPFEVKVTAEATHPTEGVLRIDRDGIPMARVPVRLTAGTNSLVVSQPAEPKPGFYRYRAVLETPAGADTDVRNNSGMGFVSVKGRPRVLVLEGKSGAGQALERAFNVYGLDVVRGGRERIPTRTEDLQSFDALFLCDFPAVNFTDTQMRLIASAVRESGVGFGMVGGENSYLPGGYYETPIADVLPVDLNIRQRKTYPSSTILIVIDASGSMGMVEDGVEKIKIAATAASATVKMLSPSDYVGVAGSTDQIEFVAPLQQARDKEAITQQIGKLSVGGGGIYIRPSLEFAYKNLSKQETRVRHLILLADGDDSDEQQGALALAARMAAEKMTISVVSIGTGKDVPFLKQLASVGRGSFYLADQAKQIQRLFTRDAAIMSRSAIEVGAFLPKVDPGDPALLGLNLRTMPPLYAYCLTSDRPLSRVPMRTAKDDPLLAFWQYGLGTSMAFTSDAQPKWATPWMGWQDFNAFWTQVARSTLRQSSTNQLRIASHREGGKGVVEVEAYDIAGNPLNNLSTRTKVMLPNGEGQEITLRQQGPGRYRGEFTASETGGYVISVAEGAQGGSPRVTRAGFSVAYPPEYQALRANDALLLRCAEITGGKPMENPTQSFRPVIRSGQSIRDLWQMLLLAALLLLPFDIAVRRIALPLHEMWTALTKRLHRTKAHEAPVVQTMDRLQKAKQSLQMPEQTDTPLEKRQDVPSLPLKTSKPEPPQETDTRSTAQRLLDIKRKQGKE